MGFGKSYSLPIIEGHAPDLALFAPLATDTSLIKTEVRHFRPVSQLSNSSSNLEFSIPGNTPHYVSLRDMRLWVQMKVTLANGEAIPEKSNVTLINLPAQTIFSNVECKLNHVTVSSTQAPFYSYCAYLGALLTKGEDAKGGPLQSAGWQKDSPYYMDAAVIYREEVVEDSSADSPPSERDSSASDTSDSAGANEGGKRDSSDSDTPDPAGANEGGVRRREYIAGSRLAEFESPIYLDVFEQSRLLLNAVHIQLTFHQNSDAFRLISADKKIGYKLQITDAVLKCTFKVLQPQVILAHSHMLKTTPALYYFKSHVFKSYTIPRGNLDFRQDNLFSGNIPEKLFAFMVSSKSFNGAQNLNPFAMQGFDLNKFAFSVEGAPVPSVFYPNFKDKRYVENYVSLMQTLNMYQRNVGCELSYDDYGGGYYVIGIDVAHNHSSDYLSLEKSGQTSIEMGFAQALPEAVNLVLVGVFDKCMQIDESRNVLL